MRWRRVRLPRIRYTIGRLMAVIFAAGLASWVFLYALPRFQYHAIAIQTTRAKFKQATLVREVAEYALKEYEEGVYKQDKATYEGMIAQARSEQERAAERMRWSTRMRDKGFVTPETVVAERLSKQRADFELEQAVAQLEVLEKYTRKEQIKAIQDDIDRARAEEQAAASAYQKEQLKRWWTILGL